MRKISEVLRLRAQGRSIREIAASVGVGHTAVGEYLRRAETAGLGWPLPVGVGRKSWMPGCSRRRWRCGARPVRCLSAGTRPLMLNQSRRQQ